MVEDSPISVVVLCSNSDCEYNLSNPDAPIGVCNAPTAITLRPTRDDDPEASPNLFRCKSYKG